MGLDTILELQIPHMSGGGETKIKVMYMRKCWSLTSKLVQYCLPYAIESDVVFRLPLDKDFWRGFYCIIHRELMAALNEQCYLKVGDSRDEEDYTPFDFYSMWDLDTYVRILERELDNLTYFIDYLNDTNNFEEMYNHFNGEKEICAEFDFKNLEVCFINSY